MKNSTYLLFLGMIVILSIVIGEQFNCPPRDWHNATTQNTVMPMEKQNDPQ